MNGAEIVKVKKITVRLDPKRAKRDGSGRYVIVYRGKEKAIVQQEFEFDILPGESEDWDEYIKGTEGIESVNGANLHTSMKIRNTVTKVFFDIDEGEYSGELEVEGTVEHVKDNIIRINGALVAIKGVLELEQIVKVK